MSRRHNQPMLRLTLPIALFALVACVDFPDLDDRITPAARAADYPTLQPLDPLLAQAAMQQTNGAITPASVATFDNKIAALRAKAAGLRGPIIDRATRAHMRRGVAVPAAIR